MSYKRRTNFNLLLPASSLTDDQQDAIDRLYDTDCTLLIAKMGSGKTVCALTAIKELLAKKVLKRVLIIAPLKVCDLVWPEEPKRWEHLQDLKIAVAIGDSEQRLNAIKSDAQIVVINFENLVWFFDKFKKAHGFDGFVIDEMSRFKSSGGAIFKKFRRYFTTFRWRLGMTGTPVSENFESMYSQALLLDGGHSLGKNKERFMQTYFYPTDYMGYTWALRDGAAKIIASQVSALVHVMPDYYDSLPPVEYKQHLFVLSDDQRERYKAFKRHGLIEIDGQEVVAVNEAVATGKLAQISSGFIYNTEEGESISLCNGRIEALKAVLARCTGNVIIAYWFQHDLERLYDFLSLAGRCRSIGSGVNKRETRKIVNEWNAGNIDYLLVHPRSAGHGLNFQDGGHEIIWFTPQWSNDLWNQTNARLWRRGQKHPVTVYSIVGVDTVDEIIEKRIEDKAEFDALLIKHLNS